MDKKMIAIGALIIVIIIIIIYKYVFSSDKDLDLDINSDGEDEDELIPDPPDLPPKIENPIEKSRAARESLSNMESLSDKDSLISSMDSIDHVTNNIFLSSWSGSTKYDKLKDENITHVITVSENKKPQYVLDNYDKIGATNHHIHMEDSYGFDVSDPVIEFEKIVNSIPSGENILVNCSSGGSRSPFLIASFLERNAKSDIDNYFIFMKSKRFNVNILDDFTNQFRAKRLNVKN